MFSIANFSAFMPMSAKDDRRRPADDFLLSLKLGLAYPEFVGTKAFLAVRKLLHTSSLPTHYAFGLV